MQTTFLDLTLSSPIVLASPPSFSWDSYMHCGIGLYGSCKHNGRLVCIEGPMLVEG